MDFLATVPSGYRWALTLALVALIVGFSTTPDIPRPDDNLFSWLYSGTPPPAQKIFHIILYAVLAFLWMWTLASIKSTRLRLGITVLLTLGLGVALEWYQTRIPGRYGTLIDIVLNACGAAIGIVVAILAI